MALEGPQKTPSPEKIGGGFHPCDFINRTIQQTLAGISLSDMADQHSNPATGNKTEPKSVTQSIETPDGEEPSQ